MSLDPFPGKRYYACYSTRLPVDLLLSLRPLTVMINKLMLVRIVISYL
jgi:hypothetical protein